MGQNSIIDRALLDLGASDPFSTYVYTLLYINYSYPAIIRSFPSSIPHPHFLASFISNKSRSVPR
jgi:hypothetical protein